MTNLRTQYSFDENASHPEIVDINELPCNVEHVLLPQLFTATVVV